LCNTDSIKFQVNTEWLTNIALINAEIKSSVLITKVRGTMKCDWLNNGQLNNKCEDRNTTDIEFVVWHTGLILHQGYIPAKHHANWKKNSHLIQCISWGLEDWDPHPIQCMKTTVSAEAASPVILMLWKLHLFVYLLNQLVLTLNGLILTSASDKSSKIEWAFTWTKRMLRCTWHCSDPLPKYSTVFPYFP
jgi:hypothetical protein